MALGLWAVTITGLHINANNEISPFYTDV